MSKFNTPQSRPAVRSPVATEVVPSGRTHEGAPGYARGAKSELFLLAVSHMADGSFYESAPERDQRFTALVCQVATADPEWMARFVPWLRNSANMRTASVVAAAETARALVTNDIPGGRQIIASALRRADEPGELLAYWTTRHGRSVPKPVKRGLADAVEKLYDEHALLKYDTASHGYRFGDVIDLVHPVADSMWRGDLYEHALDRRHGRDKPVPPSLAMIRANAALRKAAAEDPRVLLDAGGLREAGMTWEDTLSLAGPKVSKKDLWTALVPILGYMALLRNLRNVDQAGVSDEVAEKAAARIADPEQVARSRQFPFRFLAAYRAAPSLRWAYPLERALNLSLANVPELKGRTLILVDRSLSMWDAKMSAHSEMVWADAAAVFGAAVAQRSERADLVEFASRPALVTFTAADSVLKIVERFHVGNNHAGPVGSGTDIPRAVREHLRADHTRVVIVTDEQSEPGVLPSNVYGYYRDSAAMPPTRIDDLIPQSVPVFVWNIGGYKHGALPSGSGNRHALGGLTDSAFRLIPMLEAGRDARWNDLFGPPAA